MSLELGEWSVELWVQKILLNTKVKNLQLEL